MSSVKQRLKRLAKKMNNKNYSRMANELILDFYFPDFDEETGDDIPMSMAEAIDWISKRKEVAAFEERSGTNHFQETVEHFVEWSDGGFLENIAPNYPEWPEELEPYREHVDCVIAAHLMDRFNISQNVV